MNKSTIENNMKLNFKKFANINKYLRFFPLSGKWIIFFLFLSVIPLIVYFVLFNDSSFTDFLLNFGTEMLGVFVSVIIIGWLINRKEYLMWDEVDSSITRKYVSFYSKTITSFLYIFQMYSDIFPSDKEFPPKKIRTNQELTFLSDRLNDKIADKLKSFGPDKFEMFKEFISKTEENLDSLNIYPNRLNNEQIIFIENSREILDNLQSLMHLFYMNDYNTFRSTLEINSDSIRQISEIIEKLMHTIVEMRKKLEVR